MTTAKILYVHQDGWVSGSAISLKHLLTALDRSVYQPELLIAREGPVRAFFEALNVRVSCAPANGFWTAPSPPWYNPNFYRNFKAFLPNARLDEFLRSRRPDLVHINDKSMLPAGILAKRQGIPVVWHLRSAYAGGKSRLSNAISRRVINARSKALIAISEDEVEGFDRSNAVQIVYNSVDLTEAEGAIRGRESNRQELGLANDDLAIGMVGALTNEKGAWDFLEAAGEVARKTARNVRFFVIAPIPQRNLNWGWRGRLKLIDTTHPEDHAKHLCAKVGIADRIVFLGARTDTLRLLAAFDIVSACYRLWAIGRPAFEAMAVGRPVVVNEGHTGQSSIIQNGKQGLVVPRATPGALASAISTLVENDSLRDQMGDAGRRYARENFDATKNARKVEKIYQQVLNA